MKFTDAGVVNVRRWLESGAVSGGRRLRRIGPSFWREMKLFPDAELVESCVPGTRSST